MKANPASIELDLRGLKCPLPVLRTRKALRLLSPGDALVVFATDPLAAIDIPHCIREDGHNLEKHERNDAVLIFHIRKCSVKGTLF